MTKVYLYIALAVAAFAALAYYQHSQVQRGREIERQLQEKEDAKFREQLRKGARDYRTCRDLGGVWDFGRPGSCKLLGTG